MITDYEGPLGQAVIDNASVSLLLAQSDHALPRVAAVFHLTEDERAIVGRLRTVKRVRAGAYLHSRRGADSGEIGLYVTPEEYWLFTSVPAERVLRQAAIAAHAGDVWAAAGALARGWQPVAPSPPGVATIAPDNDADDPPPMPAVSVFRPRERRAGGA